MNNEVIAFLIGIVLAFIGWKIFNKVIFPIMVRHGLKETERNPKWITSRLQYYGFKDVDIVLCESKWGMLPLFTYNKKEDKIELWIPKDATVNDGIEFGRLALVGKIKARYGLWFPDKPVHWLSILCYMLDGGDVNMENQIPKENKKPLD